MARLGRSRPIQTRVLRRAVPAAPLITGRPKAYVSGSFQAKPGKVYMGSGPGWVEKPWKRWTGSAWVPLGQPGGTTRKVGEYHGVLATSHTVPLTTTTPGKDLLAIVHSAAIITMPAGWGEARIDLTDTHLGVWRLPAASHTVPLTSLAVSLSAGRQLAIVVVEDDVNALTLMNTTAGGSFISDTTFTTGVRDISRDVALAFYAAMKSSVGPYTVGAEPSAYSAGFTAFADTGDAISNSNDEALRTYVAMGSDGVLSSEAVVMTLESPGIEYLNIMFGGVLAWSRTPATGSSLFSGTPQVSHDADDTISISVGTEFSVLFPATLQAMRFLQPTNGTSQLRKCALYTVNPGGTSGTLVSGPFTMPTPVNGEWCTYILASPYVLTPNQRYRVVVWHPNGKYAYYPGGHYFDSGPGSTDTTIDGFLFRPNTFTAEGDLQGTYDYYVGDINFPDKSFNGGCYYSDVIVAPT